MATKVDSRRQQWLSFLRLLLPLFMMGFTMAEQNISSTSQLASSLHPMTVLRLISHIKARKPFPHALCKPPHLLCGPHHSLHHPITLRFLPHTLSLKLPLHPHSLPHLLHMLHIPSSSALALHMHHTLSLCHTSPHSTCSSSFHHMLHFVTSNLASSRHLRILKPSLPIPSHFLHHHTLTLARVSAGPSVTCHQLLFPFALFLCHALEATTHTLEVEINGREGTAVVQCKQGGLCEWVREGSFVWVMKGEAPQAEANSAWLNQKFFGHLGNFMNVKIENNTFNNSGSVSFTKSSNNYKPPTNGSQNGSGNGINANAGAESASQEPNQTGTASTSSDAASPSDGSTNSNSKASGDSLSSTPSGSGSTAINGDSSSTSTPPGSGTNSGTDDGTANATTSTGGSTTGATDSSSTTGGSPKTKKPTLLHH